MVKRKLRILCCLVLCVFSMVVCFGPITAFATCDEELEVAELTEMEVLAIEAQVDQRSEKAMECLNLSATATSLLVEDSVQQPEMATLLLESAVDEDGVTVERYMTIARASSDYKTNSNVAGELTAVVRIYWKIEYDSLLNTSDIAFDKSTHYYYNSGSSSVTRMYGENYVALGNNYDANSNTWYNPAAGSVKTLTNGLSNEYSWDSPINNNCMAHAVTEIVSSLIGTLRVDVEIDW